MESASQARVQTLLAKVSDKLAFAALLSRNDLKEVSNLRKEILMLM